MKALLHVYASLNDTHSPYYILEVPEGTSEEGLQIIAEKFLPTLYGNEDAVRMDSDGVCWNRGECWYIEDLRFISEEDAAHLVRILSLSTF